MDRVGEDSKGPRGHNLLDDGSLLEDPGNGVRFGFYGDGDDGWFEEGWSAANMGEPDGDWSQCTEIHRLL